jgi:hypothetical protein
MPYVAGRYLPESIVSVPRASRTARVRLAINADPNLDGPDRYTYAYRDMTVGQTMKTRRMLQKSTPANFYEFSFPPSQIVYEGAGVDISEIPIPLSRPLVDIRASKNNKAVFEFLVAEPLDGLSKSVEQQLVTLEWMANMGEPVYFENFDTFLTNGFWYIAEFSIKTSRVNTNGEIVAAQCSMGLLEYQDRNTQFTKFPKLRYTDLTRRPGGGGGGGGGGGEPDTSEDGADQGTTPGTTGGTPPAGGTGQSQVTVTSGKKYYRFTRNTKPSNNETYGHFWKKEGNSWVYYSNSPQFPTIVGARVARGFIAKVQASRTEGFVGNLKGQAKINYLKTLAAAYNSNISRYNPYQGR